MMGVSAIGFAPSPVRVDRFGNALAPVNVLFLTTPSDAAVLRSRIEEGRRWLEAKARRRLAPFAYKQATVDLKLPDVSSPLVEQYNVDYLAVRDWVQANYPRGRYLVFVGSEHGGRGMAQGAAENFTAPGAYPLAALGQFYWGPLVSEQAHGGDSPAIFPWWTWMGAWIHELGHTYGAQHEDGGIMGAEMLWWPYTFVPASLIVSPMFGEPITVPTVLATDRTLPGDGTRDYKNPWGETEQGLEGEYMALLGAFNARRAAVGLAPVGPGTAWPLAEPPAPTPAPVPVPTPSTPDGNGFGLPLLIVTGLVLAAGTRR